MSWRGSPGGLVTAPELIAAAAEGSGALPWITLGLFLGLAIGFLYAAVRHVVRSRRRP